MRGEPGDEYEAVFLTIPAFRSSASPDYPKWAGVRTKTAVYATFEDGVTGLNGGNGGFIMHDLTADPEELANLVDLPEHAVMQPLWDTLQILAEDAGELSYFNMPPRPTLTRVNGWRMY